MGDPSVLRASLAQQEAIRATFCTPCVPVLRASLAQHRVQAQHVKLSLATGIGTHQQVESLDSFFVHFQSMGR